MLSGRTLRSAGACKAARSCAVRPQRELGCPGGQVAAQRIQTHAQRETTSRPSSGLRHTTPERRRPLQGRSSDTVRGVLGVPWLEGTHLVAAHGVPGNDTLLSMRVRMWCGEIPMWPQKRRGPLRTASPGSGILVAAFLSVG
ncbi:hypothetical protein TcYC6_0037460 [Trypanosoma cruzi]|nr:hypothetical protein TcYC6_0037460 [Trypanosoma cruzi]